MLLFLQVAIDASNASKASEELKNITQSDPITMPPSQLNSIAKILEELSTFASDEKVRDLELLRCKNSSYIQCLLRIGHGH